MSLPFFIARRYLFSQKSHNAINLISAIAVVGIALATMAMVCTLSVFNGFRDLIGTLYTHFDPQLVVLPAQGKYLAADDTLLQRIAAHPAIAATSATFEEDALILFRGHPLVVRIKGVDANYEKVTDIRALLQPSDARPAHLPLHAAGVNYGIPGEGLAAQIGTLDYGTLQICAPRAGERINVTNPIESFSVENLHAPGIAFSVGQRKYDEHYILTSLDFATTLFEKQGHLSRLEIRLRPHTDPDAVRDALRTIGGPRLRILNRAEQQADVFNIMQVEKLIAYVFLTFIVLLACFNIISSLSMLILEKRDDADTLRHLGMTPSRIRRIFMTEGRLISLMGATLGILLGVGLCLLQQEYGLIRLGNSHNFIVEAYPVALHAQDLVLIFATVIAVGFLSVWYPVHALSRRLL